MSCRRCTSVSVPEVENIMRSARSGSQASRFRWWSALRTCFGAVLGLWTCGWLLAFLPASSSKASDPPAWVPSHSRQTDDTIRDLELTLRARKALLKEDALATQNVGVSVRSGVATLWGIVSRKELGQHAEKSLQSVIGLKGIRNELRVEGVDANVPLLAMTKPTPPTPLAEPLSQDKPRTQESTARRPADQALLPGQEPVWRAAGRGDAAVPTSASSTSPTTSLATGTKARQEYPGARPAAQSDTPLTIMPSIALPGQAASAGQTNGLAQAIESLRLRDGRFERVQAQATGGIVTLRGTVDRWEHLFELAKQISRLPGVQRVVFEGVHAQLEP